MPAWNARSAIRSGLSSAADGALGVSSPAGGEGGFAIATVCVGAGCSAGGGALEPHGFNITNHVTPTAATTPPAT